MKRQPVSGLLLINEGNAFRGVTRKFRYNIKVRQGIRAAGKGVIGLKFISTVGRRHEDYESLIVMMY